MRLIAVGANCLDLFAVNRRRTVFGDEVHETRDADVRLRRRAKHGNKRLLLDGRMNTSAQLVLGQITLVKELLEQRIVGLGDVLDQLLVQLVDLFRPVAGGRDFLKLAAKILLISDDLTAHDIQNGVEAGAGIDRPVHREDAFAIMFAALGQDLLEVRLFLVHRVNHNHLRDAVLRGVTPTLIGSDAHAVVNMDHHQSEVAHAQCPQTFADEVKIARRVDDVELLPQPFCVEQGCVHGDLALLLAYVVIRDGRAVGDATHPVNDAAAHQHGLA